MQGKFYDDIHLATETDLLDFQRQLALSRLWGEASNELLDMQGLALDDRKQCWSETERAIFGRSKCVTNLGENSHKGLRLH